jgi:hypothetical protein
LWDLPPGSRSNIVVRPYSIESCALLVLLTSWQVALEVKAMDKSESEILIAPLKKRDDK